MSRSPRPVVVVGAGATGSAAALMLRQEGFAGRIVLVGEEPHAPYERPPLSKEALTGAEAPAPVAIHPEAAFEEHRVDLRLGARASSVARDGRVTLTSGETIAASRVLLATGGRPRRLPVPGMELRGVHTLRDLGDALALRAAVAQAGAVVVVGGGVLGAEVAASARSLGREVTIVEAGGALLERAVGTTVGQLFSDAHRAAGIGVLTGEQVTALHGESGDVRAVALADGTTVPADLVVVAVGLEPEVASVAGLGIGDTTGIRVDARGATAIPGVFAAGDVAYHPSGRSGRHHRLEHWRHAQAHGAAVARSMLGVGDDYDEVPWFWSDQLGLRLQVAGHPEPSDEVVLRGELGADGLLAFYLHHRCLVAVAAVDRPRDLRRLLRHLAVPAPFDAALLADPTVPVAELRPLQTEVAR